MAFGKRAVVISGDTRDCENVIQHAKDTDLLLHEVASAPDDIKSLPSIKRLLDHHTSRAEAGRIFEQARPRLAAFTHLALLPNLNGVRPSVEDVVAETRTTYEGPLVVGDARAGFRTALT